MDVTGGSPQGTKWPQVARGDKDVPEATLRFRQWSSVLGMLSEGVHRPQTSIVSSADSELRKCPRQGGIGRHCQLHLSRAWLLVWEGDVLAYPLGCWQGSSQIHRPRANS